MTDGLDLQGVIERYPDDAWEEGDARPRSIRWIRSLIDEHGRAVYADLDREVEEVVQGEGEEEERAQGDRDGGDSEGEIERPEPPPEPVDPPRDLVQLHCTSFIRRRETRARS